MSIINLHFNLNNVCQKYMDYPKVELKWYEIIQGAMTGVLREVESLRNNVKWGHNYNGNQYQKWGQTISGALCEMALAKKFSNYFTHSVNNYFGKDIIINGKPVQIKSQLITKDEKYLTIRPNYKDEDYYFLVIDDMPTFYICGYIQAKDCQKLGNWTDKGYNRPYFWEITLDKLKPISEFKNE